MEMQQQEMQIQAMKAPINDPTKNPALAQQLAEGGQASPQPADLPTNN